VPEIADRWATPGTDADDEFAQALTEVSSGATQRGGRLLAPYAVRYIVVPRFDGGQSTPSDPIDPPLGLSDALGAQLDLRHLFTSPSFDVFENTAAFPGTAAFTGSLADATAAAGSAELVRRDLSGATAVLTGALSTGSASGDAPTGVVALAVPFDEQWKMSVAGEDIAAQRSFGVLTGFDVADGGSAELDYETPSSRHAALAGQALLWVAAILAASRLRMPLWMSRRRSDGDRRAVIDLDENVALPTDTGEVPVLVPLEPVAAATQPAAAQAWRPLFRADDDASRAAWVEEMFADEDELQ
jgi:hypothetical protein